MSKIILFGASGQQGGAIAKKLKSAGHRIVAPVRSTKNEADLHQKEIETRLTDFSTASLTPIIKEGDQVVLQVPAVITPSEMIAFAENALKAIANAGSPHTVFNISSIIPKEFIGLEGPDARLTLKNLSTQLAPHTIVLSSTLYLENFSQAYRQAIEQGGVIPQAIPNDTPVAYLSLDDLAAFVLAALEKPHLRGKFIPIGGSEVLNGMQLAEKIGNVVDKSIYYQAITPQDLAIFLTPMIGETTALQVAEMYSWEGTLGSSLLNPNVAQAQEILDVSLPSFEEWAIRAFSNSDNQ